MDTSVGSEGTSAATPSESVQGTVSEGEVTAITPIAPTSTESTATDIDPFGDEKVQTFERSYVEKIRSEAAEARVELKKFKETFNEWPQEAVEGFLSLAKAIETGDTSAVPVLENLLNQMTPEQQAAVENALDQKAVETETKYMTPEQVEEYIAQREASKEEERKTAQAEQQAMESLKSEISALGYNLDSQNPEATLLFHFAGSQEGEGPKDFKKAHEAVQAFKQSLIDDYRDRVVGRNSKFARSAVTTGLAPLGFDGGNKNLGLQSGGSRKALEEYLASSD
jgi:hypothetical protein